MTTTDTLQRRGTSPAQELGRAVRAELVKLRDTPSVWLLAGLAVLAVLLGIGLTIILRQIRTVEDVRSLLSFTAAGGFMVILLGLVVSAGEYRHRTIVPTTLADPGRARSFGGQMLALALVGLAVGVVASVLVTAFTFVGAAMAADPPPVAAADILVAVVGGIVYTTIAAVLGGAIGALARNQVAGAIAMFVYLSMVDPLVGMAVPNYGQFGPIALGIAIGGASPDPSGGPGALLLAPVVAGAVWFSYAAVLSIAAFVSTTKRELP